MAGCRAPRGAAWELWVRGFSSLSSFTPRPGYAFSVAVAWRTPDFERGIVRLNLAPGVGVTVGSLCARGDTCEALLGPRVELLPTVEFAVSSLVRPYLALPVSGTFEVFSRAPGLTAGLAVGVLFHLVDW